METTIITADPQEPTKAIETIKRPDEVNEIPNYITVLKSQVQDIDSQIEETQTALNTFNEQQDLSTAQRREEFTSRISGLQSDREALVHKIADAVDAGVVEG